MHTSLAFANQITLHTSLLTIVHEFKGETVHCEKCRLAGFDLYRIGLCERRLMLLTQSCDAHACPELTLTTLNRDAEMLSFKNLNT